MIDFTEEALDRMLVDDPGGPVVMLNLLRFEPDGGAARYLEYVQSNVEVNARYGVELLYAGASAAPLVAENGQAWWDAVAIVRYPNRQAFRDMIGDPEYAGAYLLDTYELSPGTAGLVLGAAAAGYFPGTLLARRSVERHARAMLVGFGLAAAATVIAFTTVRLSPVESAALLGLLMSAIGARTIAAGAFDLHASPDRRAALMGIRAAHVSVLIRAARAAPQTHRRRGSTSIAR